MKIGFIGTGHMGKPMAFNLIKAGHEVVVNDLSRGSVEDLLQAGGTWADTPREVAEVSGVIFTSLPGPAQVEEVVMGKNGILAGCKPGTIHADLTSNSVTMARHLERAEAEQGVRYLDAPVSGGVTGATNGTLAIMVGGDRAAYDKVLPLLEVIGGNVFHLGPVGNGTVVKLTNNLIRLAPRLVIEEALALGVKAGLTPQQMYDVWSTSSSGPTVQVVPGLLERAWEPASFSMNLATKDLGLCMEVARDLGVPMGVSGAAHQVYLRSLVRGHGNKRPEASLKTIEDEAGVEIGTVTRKD